MEICPCAKRAVVGIACSHCAIVCSVVIFGNYCSIAVNPRNVFMGAACIRISLEQLDIGCACSLVKCVDRLIGLWPRAVPGELQANAYPSLVDKPVGKLV